MPVIRIEVPEDTEGTRKRTRQGVKYAVLTTLAPKEVKFDYVAIREALGELGDGLSFVAVDLRPDRAGT